MRRAQALVPRTDMDYSSALTSFAVQRACGGGQDARSSVHVRVAVAPRSIQRREVACRKAIEWVRLPSLVGCRPEAGFGWQVSGTWRRARRDGLGACRGRESLALNDRPHDLPERLLSSRLPRFAAKRHLEDRGAGRPLIMRFSVGHVVSANARSL